jgi:hypothetical protein
VTNALYVQKANVAEMWRAVNADAILAKMPPPCSKTYTLPYIHSTHTCAGSCWDIVFLLHELAPFNIYFLLFMTFVHISTSPVFASLSGKDDIAGLL